VCRGLPAGTKVWGWACNAGNGCGHSAFSAIASDGDRNAARVTGDSSTAQAFAGDGNTATVDGNNNTATVDGNFSSAIAGPEDNNTATATGDFVFGATAVGNGTEVHCTPEGCS
jgi:hypothetical protein